VSPLGDGNIEDGNISAERMQFLLNLRRRGISNSILRAMDKVPREQFVEPAFMGSSYADQALPIACGQTISQPYVVAYMTEQLNLLPEHHVLEIGTGSGYQTAVLSQLAHDIVSIERYRTLAESAKKRLGQLGYNNIEIIVGDGFAGFPAKAPYDRIIVTAAVEKVPPELLAQLAQDGVMVLPLGSQDKGQCLVKLTKSQRAIEHQDLIPVRFVPLVSGKAQEL
jgi:protein-L-isoaspartate(D-aspartate) O-methyltransferase